MGTNCAYEIQWKHFGFADCQPEQFYAFQVRKRIKLLLLSPYFKYFIILLFYRSCYAKNI